MSTNANAQSIKKAIEEITKEIAEGIRAARKRGVICGPAMNVTLVYGDYEDSTGELIVTLKSLTISSIDATE
ncbi:MAG: hypothetical protein JW942_06840 [Opitutales bacterium]|nr:hypothetical protein [Opitutales bacterium]